MNTKNKTNLTTPCWEALEVHEELTPEGEMFMRNIERRRKLEIESRLSDARLLYPEFDRHCKEHDFDEILLLWQYLLSGYSDFEIRKGFCKYFRASGEFITPAGVIRNIKEKYKN